MFYNRGKRARERTKGENDTAGASLKQGSKITQSLREWARSAESTHVTRLGTRGEWR